MRFLQKLSDYRFSRYSKVLFVCWDLIILNIAIYLSFIVRFGTIDNLLTKDERTISLFTNLIWIGLLLHKDSHRIIRIEYIETILQRTIKKIFIHIAFVVFFVVILKYYDISRLRLLCFYLFFFTFLVISRYVLMKVLKYMRAKGYNFKKIIIVGANNTGEKIHKILAKDLTYGYKFLGFFDENQTGNLNPLTIRGGFDEVQEFIITEKVDEVYVALHIDKVDIITKLIKICEQNMVRIKIIPDFQLYTKSSKVEIAFYENTPVLMLRSEPLELAVNRIIKKVFDVCFSILVILLIFPWLFPIVMLIIKLESKGPIFFKQARSGRDNKSFVCFKFRSMYLNDKAHDQQAKKGDSRVTKFGSFMRKTSIDELPQFFNVLWGSMSVVGPRPHMINLAKEYGELIDNYSVRHFAKPGITGWAQVNGYRGETKKLKDMENRVECDIWYIENWSLLLDIKIIVRTLINVLKGDDNAY
ncbi:undecaprenyl-phosphate glucose phosphotransferase [Flavobacterium sp. DG2-3]|uniref:undecaprenyl-phosphate glucose phosphotransferase n=1 Tax=Flavobacterium sp. DG2-3 TaxID=3068317 RepID=UPI00273EC060|nr:undecaprenyl-phosphate glucose phosphotransferase [Flavobacterium sp. DG2-3]MDP5199617.1 undecaprenyl-phosphate glucose phosphotransferase [Flavobacterium sp. DG2-3]